MRYCFLLLAFCVTVLSEGRAQVTMLFMPEINGRHLDGLGIFQIQNLSGRRINGSFLITVQDNKSKQQLVRIKTNDYPLEKGLTSFPRNLFVGASFGFFSNPLSQLLQQTRNIPAGDYTYCFQFVENPKEGTDEYESCIDAEIEPLVPISLLRVDDKDTICDTRPMLAWQPPLPYHPSMRFRLLLTEKKAGESVENLLVNAPLVYLNEIAATSVGFPITAMPLQENKTYCWQVITYQSGVVLSRSEIWEFTVSCSKRTLFNEQDAYRELKQIANGNYYIAEGGIRFSFMNEYNLKKLRYEIIDISKEAKPIKGLPDVTLSGGLNKIHIDLSSSDLREGKYYVLKVYPFNEPVLEVKFIYKEAIQN